MKLSISNRGLAVLLVVDGALLFLTGFIISRLVDPPGAGALGLLLLIGNLVAAYLVVRRERSA